MARIHVEELAIIHRFDDIAGHALAETLDDVPFFAGGGQDDNRDLTERRIELGDALNLRPVHLGHVQVEQDDARSVVGGVSEIGQGILRR